MTASERRKIMCSVTFHVIAITCVVWSLYVLIDRTAEEIKQGESTGMLLCFFQQKTGRQKIFAHLLQGKVIAT